MTTSDERNRDAERRLLDGLDLGRPRPEEEADELLRVDQAILLEQEEFVRACMAEEGFDYFFDRPEEQVQRFSGFEEPWGSPEWVTRYGFGLSTLLFAQDEVGDDLVGAPGAVPRPPPADEATDPTTLQLDALGPAGRAAYWRALLGFSRTDGDEPSDRAYSASCKGRAEEAHPDRGSLVHLEWGASEIDQLRARIETSHVVRDAVRRGWLCVESSGFSVSSEQAAIADVEVRLEGLFDFGRPDASNPEFSAFLEDVQTYELALAHALEACGVSRARLAPIREQVAIELAYEIGLLEPQR